MPPFERGLILALSMRPRESTGLSRALQEVDGMRMSGRKRVASALLAVWIGAGAIVSAAAAREVPSLEAAVVDAAAPAGAANCSATISCGAVCSAKLASGFCTLAFSWEARAKFGWVQIGPSFEGECHICECWYIYTNSLGNSIFKRATDTGCSGGFSGLEIHVQ
jgi:hypothetical protein